ncbi:copper-binding protein [Polaromonas jejuensis]|uniref:Copper-binding protein n=1 Tax=Polaromonas jejuensis TaxID=457502 RepID=A0ABW0QGF6_9BURK|nr:copper-binding protein [Polaromonas jejuensis]
MTKGTVKKINGKTGWVLMAQGPVNSMSGPAMTMSFKVRDKEPARQAGDRQEGRFRIFEGGRG